MEKETEIICRKMERRRVKNKGKGRYRDIKNVKGRKMESKR